MLVVHPMLIVYLAGPFRSKAKPYNYFEQHHNITRAEDLAWEVWNLGVACISPHLNTVHFQGSLPDEVWLKGDLAIMERCDVVLMTADWSASQGAITEHKHAIELSIPVVYSLEELREFLQTDPTIPNLG